MNHFKYFLFIITVLIIPIAAYAESAEYFSHAKVVQVISQEQENIPSTDAVFTTQAIKVRFSGDYMNGEEVEMKNDLVPMKVGDTFIARIIVNNEENTKEFVVSDFERRPTLAVLAALFLIAVVIFGRMQGVRSLVSLGVSGLVIFFVLIPLLLKGYHPVLVSTITSAAVLFFAIFFTHGFNRKSLIAFSGTFLAVLITSVLAQIAVTTAHITGFATHESVYLNFNTGGTLDFVGLFLAGIMIGMLGVLDDISITQVAVVRELYGVAPHLTKKELFASAIRVGKEHVGALVNTLVLAYVGVALPSILYFATSYTSIGQMVNMEIFAAEIIRTIIGSIGLILTVPITTMLAVYFLKDFKGKKMTLDELEHGHSHAHGGHGHSH
jgi:uncharacterized membrane protein